MDKQQLRRSAYVTRNAQVDKDHASATICRQIVDQTWYQRADTVMWYVHCRSEMRTLPALQQQLVGNKRIVVPFCTVDDFDNRCLGLWLLEDVAELKPGMWNIQEPPRERWQEAGKILKPDELDAVIVPGVAFDQYGGRLGNGAGYYDRLLQCVRPDTVLAGVCYQSQIVSSVPMQSHDVFMNFVITEQTIYPGSRGR